MTKRRELLRLSAAGGLTMAGWSLFGCTVFRFGSGFWGVYDGSNLAREQDVVIVPSITALTRSATWFAKLADL